MVACEELRELSARDRKRSVVGVVFCLMLVHPNCRPLQHLKVEV